MIRYDKTAMVYGDGKRCGERERIKSMCCSAGSYLLGVLLGGWTECSINERLRTDQQHLAYQHDGVKLPQSIDVSSFQICVRERDVCSLPGPNCCLD